VVCAAKLCPGCPAGCHAGQAWGICLEVKKGLWNTRNSNWQSVILVGSGLPWKHLNCIVKCLQFEQEIGECFLSAVNCTVLAVEA